MQKTDDKTITFYFRGQIEWGRNRVWCDGYSANSANGGTIYPWETKQMCRQEAKSRGLKAVFKEI